MNRRHSLIAIALCFIPFLSLFCESHAQGSSSLLEITEVDLFDSKDWNSTQISILGLMLGMSRPDCFKAIQKWDLHLDDSAGEGCLKAQSCYVSKWAEYSGVSIGFDDNDHLEKIRIEAYQLDAPKGNSISWIARHFHGETSRFVSLYSENLTDAENLRARILGLSTFKGGGKIQMGGPTHNEYWYGRFGLVVIVDVDENYGWRNARRTRRLELEFIRPH